MGSTAYGPNFAQVINDDGSGWSYYKVGDVTTAFSWGGFQQSQPAAPVLNESARTAVTGIELDQNFAEQIIGQEIPVFVGGQALVGCRLAELYVYTRDGDPYCNMIVTSCVPATPSASRSIKSIRMNGVEVWTSTSGWLNSELSEIELDFRYGTEDQLPFQSCIDRFGSSAVPYRPHILVELKNVPLLHFSDSDVPFISIHIFESDYLTHNDALEKLAAYARFDTSELDVDVSGISPFWMVIKQSTFMSYLQDLQRTIGRNWNIVANDKLRIFENDSSAVATQITRNDFVAGSLKFRVDEPNSVPTVRHLGFINTGADNQFGEVKGFRERFPIPLTTSESSDNFDIPIGMEEGDAKYIANRSILIDDIARAKFACRLLPHKRGFQPGDIVALDIDGVTPADYRINSVARNAADWTIDIVAERVELVAIPPRITSDGAASTAAITVLEGATEVTTVTADQVGCEFSIVGGEDAALFTIDADTGELEFITPPDYGSPGDVGANNTYNVTVQALINGLRDTQAITVTVLNRSELDFSKASNSNFVAVIEEF